MKNLVLSVALLVVTVLACSPAPKATPMPTAQSQPSRPKGVPSRTINVPNGINLRDGQGFYVQAASNGGKEVIYQYAFNAARGLVTQDVAQEKVLIGLAILNNKNYVQDQRDALGRTLFKIYGIHEEGGKKFLPIWRGDLPLWADP